MSSNIQLHRKLLWLPLFVCIFVVLVDAPESACAQIRSLSYGINDKPVPPAVVIQASALRAAQGKSPGKSSESSVLKSATMHLGDQSRERSSHTLDNLDILPAGEAMPLGGDKKMELIEFSDVTLAEAMRLFAEQSGLNVITSAEAGKTMLTVYLKNVTAISALDAIVKANGLF